MPASQPVSRSLLDPRPERLNTIAVAFTASECITITHSRVAGNPATADVRPDDFADSLGNRGRGGRDCRRLAVGTPWSGFAHGTTQRRRLLIRKSVDSNPRETPNEMVVHQ